MNATKEGTLLESLITPKTHSDFMQSYQYSQPFIIHDLSKSIAEITSLPFLSSLSSLLELWPREVDVHLPDISDEANTITVSTKQARVNFEQGKSLLFNDVNDISPELTKWVETIKHEIGFSEMTYARNLVYATPAGAGNTGHFDQNINLVLQIQGEKKWWLAPNHHVENPMTRHVIGLETDPELASYCPPMPDDFPENATEYTLKAGSLLFVPRGTWHKTEAVTDALSLNFTFSAPTWIDILTTALRGRLAQSSKWRESAKVHCPEKFDELLNELKADLPNWQADGILGATEARHFND